MSLTSPTAFGHHSGMDETVSRPSVFQMLRLLVTSPQQVVLALKQQTLKPAQAFQMSGLFLLAVTVLFTLSTLIPQPAQTPWTSLEVALRVGFSMAVTGGIALPLMVVAWSLLQKFSAWYWGVPMTYLNTLLLSGLGLGYFVLMLVLGLPIVSFLPTLGWGGEALLFLLNSGAFFLLLRLFYTAYRQEGTLSRKKAAFISLFPLFILTVIYSATQLLTYFAMVPYLRGAGH